ncbi:MAG: chromosome segregation ATPase [Porticoccus sp.]|jgi:chromosome segregation ATPase
MANKELRAQLDQLHKELEKANALAPEDRDLFGHLLSDMVRIAQGEEPGVNPKESLRDQLEHKASDFESDHPRLAAIVRQVLDSLNKMGI